MIQHVAVIDIGKTNAKIVLVDRQTLREIAVVTRPNIVRPGPPWPHFDVEGHWDFILDGLRDFHRQHRIDAITVTTHGACAALLNDAGELAAPILDYESDAPEAVADEYNAIRPAFSEEMGVRAHWLRVQHPVIWALSCLWGNRERKAASYSAMSGV